MRSRSIWATMFALAFALCATSAKAQAQGQNQQPILYTYVSSWSAPRAHWSDMEKFAQGMRQALDRLVDDGTLTGYGFVETVVHRPDEPTQFTWIQASSVGAILRALSALKEVIAASPALIGVRHSDSFLRSTVNAHKSGNYDHGYLWVGSFTIKPGHVDDWSANFKTYMAPELSKMVDSGTLAAFQLDTNLAHSGNPNTLDYAFVTTGANGIDDVQAMIRRIEGANPAIGSSFDSWEENTGHSDEIAHVIFMRIK